MRAAIQYAIDNDRKSVTLVHKGNIMKFTEGLLPRLRATSWPSEEFGAEPIDGGPWCKFKNPKTGRDIVVKDAIADAFLQQILLRPAEYDVIATCNLNGDYISDALAAQVGGIGIAPGANISDQYACFEATHGTAPKYAGLDKVNPGSLILSGRDDAAPHGLDRGRRPGHQGDGSGHRRQAGHLRLRPPDGRRHRGLLLGLRRRDDRAACRPGRRCRLARLVASVPRPPAASASRLDAAGRRFLPPPALRRLLTEGFGAAAHGGFGAGRGNT